MLEVGAFVPCVAVRRLGMVLAGLVLAATAAPAAHAASLTISAPDEALEGTTVPIRYSGDASNNAPSLEARLRTFAVPAGQGEPCPDARTYGGNELAASGTSVPKGPFDVDGSTSFNDAAVLRICASLFATPDFSTSEILASASKVLTIRPPRLALQLAVPQGLRAPATFGLTATASAEAPRELLAAVIPDLGAGCPSTANALAQTSGAQAFIGQSVVGGPMTVAATARSVAAGRYLACGYLSKAITPQLVTAPVPFTVAPSLNDLTSVDMRVRLTRKPARALRRGDRVTVYALITAKGKTEKTPTITVTSTRGFKLRRASVGPGVRCRMVCPIDGPIGTGSPAYTVRYELTYRGGVSRPTFSVRVNTKLGDAKPADNVASMRGDRRAKPIPKSPPRG